METVFFSALFLLFYVYAGYPLLAAALGCVLRRGVRKFAIEPKVSIVIAAYNEEEVIAATLENKLALDYPAALREILVVSDGSTDRTDAIIDSFAARGIMLLRQSRSGKTTALNLALSVASGEVVVFSDANSIYATDALRRLVANFADPGVGYVTGRMVYANPDGTPTGEGCGAYMVLENALRGIETRLGSVIGVDGGIDAVRRRLYRPMKADLLPDFVLPLAVVEQGYRVVYEPRALLCEASLKEDVDEYRMRVRVSLRALWALFEMRRLLDPLRYPLFAWQLWSHKVLRYLCFVFLLVAYLSNLWLLDKALGYRLSFLGQNLVYLAALLVPYCRPPAALATFFTFSRYFSLLNVAAGHAWLKFLLGKRQVTWAPRKG